MEFKDILNEYNKYIVSRLINKEYDFNNFRTMLKEFNEMDDIFNYSDDLTERQVIENIKEARNKLLKDDNFIPFEE